MVTPITLSMGDSVPGVESLSVEVAAGDDRPFQYAVVSGDETVATYRTSADLRTRAGRLGLGNVICRHVPAAENAAVEEQLAAAVADRSAALAAEFGDR